MTTAIAAVTDGVSTFFDSVGNRFEKKTVLNFRYVDAPITDGSSRSGINSGSDLYAIDFLSSLSTASSNIYDNIIDVFRPDARLPDAFHDSRG